MKLINKIALIFKFIDKAHKKNLLPKNKKKKEQQTKMYCFALKKGLNI